MKPFQYMIASSLFVSLLPAETYIVGNESELRNALVSVAKSTDSSNTINLSSDITLNSTQLPPVTTFSTDAKTITIRPRSSVGNVSLLPTLPTEGKIISPLVVTPYARINNAPNTLNVVIDRIDFEQCKSAGGDGGNANGYPGGGALGAGGAIFVDAGATVTITNSNFFNCSATGGNGGSVPHSRDHNGGGGGGGMFGGNGGGVPSSDNNNEYHGGGGGGGFASQGGGNYDVSTPGTGTDNAGGGGGGGYNWAPTSTTGLAAGGFPSKDTFGGAGGGGTPAPSSDGGGTGIGETPTATQGGTGGSGYVVTSGSGSTTAGQAGGVEGNSPSGTLNAGAGAGGGGPRGAAGGDGTGFSSRGAGGGGGASDDNGAPGEGGNGDVYGGGGGGGAQRGTPGFADEWNGANGGNGGQFGGGGGGGGTKDPNGTGGTGGSGGFGGGGGGAGSGDSEENGGTGGAAGYGGGAGSGETLGSTSTYGGAASTGQGGGGAALGGAIFVRKINGDNQGILKLGNCTFSNGSVTAGSGGGVDGDALGINLFLQTDTLYVPTGFTQTLGGGASNTAVVVENAAFTLLGGGRLILENNAFGKGADGEFEGNYTISEGTLEIKEVSVLGTSNSNTISIGSSGTLTYTGADAGGDETLAHTIQTLDSTYGTLNLTNANILTLPTGCTIGALTGGGSLKVSNGGNLTFLGSDDSTYSGEWQDNGTGNEIAVYFAGSGTQTLAGTTSTRDLFATLNIASTAGGAADQGNLLILNEDAVGENTTIVVGANGLLTLDSITTLLADYTGTGAISKAGQSTLILAAGRDQFTGTFSITDGTVIANAADALCDHTNGTVSIASGATLEIPITSTYDTIGGAGNVTKTGATTLAIGTTGSRTYSGTTTISGAGGISVTAENALSPNSKIVLETSAASTLTVSADNTIPSIGGSGVLEISDGNTLYLTNASQTFTGTLNSSGTLSVSSGTMNLNGNAGSFSGDITSTGGKITLTDTLSTSYDGTLSVSNGGEIAVRSNLPLATATVTGGLLSGTGTIGGATISNAALRPGASIGTLTVAGNLVLGASSSLENEFNAAGNTDLVLFTTSGDLTLNASSVLLLAPKASGLYQDGTVYTIIDGFGSRDGEFGTITNTDPTLFDAVTMVYNTDNIQFVIGNMHPSGPSGRTHMQKTSQIGNLAYRTSEIQSRNLLAINETRWFEYHPCQSLSGREKKRGIEIYANTALGAGVYQGWNTIQGARYHLTATTVGAGYVIDDTNAFGIGFGYTHGKSKEKPGNEVISRTDALSFDVRIQGLPYKYIGFDITNNTDFTGIDVDSTKLQGRLTEAKTHAVLNTLRSRLRGQFCQKRAKIQPIIGAMWTYVHIAGHNRTGAVTDAYSAEVDRFSVVNGEFGVQASGAFEIREGILTPYGEILQQLPIYNKSRFVTHSRLDGMRDLTLEIDPIRSTITTVGGGLQFQTDHNLTAYLNGKVFLGNGQTGAVEGRAGLAFSF